MGSKPAFVMTDSGNCHSGKGRNHVELYGHGNSKRSDKSNMSREIWSRSKRGGVQDVDLISTEGTVAETHLSPTIMLLKGGRSALRRHSHK